MEEKPKNSMKPKREKPPTKGPGEVLVHMKIDEKHEWNFKARGPMDAIYQGKRICSENGFKFLQDVIEWDFS